MASTITPWVLRIVVVAVTAALVTFQSNTITAILVCIALVVVSDWLLQQRDVAWRERLRVQREEKERRVLQKQAFLRDEPNTPREPAEWLNKLLLSLWPNCLHPHLVASITASIEKHVLLHGAPAFSSVEISELSLGDSAPQVGPRGACWATRTLSPSPSNSSPQPIIRTASLAVPRTPSHSPKKGLTAYDDAEGTTSSGGGAGGQESNVEQGLMVDCEWHSADLSARLSLMLDQNASATVEWLKRAGLSAGPMNTTVLNVHITSVKLRTTAWLVPSSSTSALSWSLHGFPEVSVTATMDNAAPMAALLGSSSAPADVDAWLSHLLASWIADSFVEPHKQVIPLIPAFAPFPSIPLPATPSPSRAPSFASFSLAVLSAHNLHRPITSFTSSSFTPLPSDGLNPKPPRGESVCDSDPVLGPCIVEVICQDLHRSSNRSATAGTSPRWVPQLPLSPSPSSQSTATSTPPGAVSAAQSSLPGPEAFLQLRAAGPQVRVVLRVLEVLPAGDAAKERWGVGGGASEKVDVDVGGKLQRCLLIGSTELTMAYAGIDVTHPSPSPSTYLCFISQGVSTQLLSLSPDSPPLTLTLALQTPAITGKLQVLLTPPQWLPHSSLQQSAIVLPSTATGGSSLFPPLRLPQLPSFPTSGVTVVRVTVLQGRQLWRTADEGSGSSSSVQAMVEVQLGESRGSTSLASDVNPVWSHSFSFTHDHSLHGPLPAVLVLRCSAALNGSALRRKPMGWAALALPTSPSPTRTSDWVPLTGEGGMGDLLVDVEVVPPVGLIPAPAVPVTTSAAAAGDGGGVRGERRRETTGGSASATEGEGGEGGEREGKLRRRATDWRGRDKTSRPSGPLLQVTVLGVRGLQAAVAAATAAASTGGHRGSSGGVPAGAGSGDGRSRPPDAYATITYGAVKRRTKVVSRTWQPEWLQQFDFEDIGDSLEIAVKDHHSRVLALAGPATVLAAWPVTYRHLAEDQTHTLWLPLSDSHRSSSATTSSSGGAVICELGLTLCRRSRPAHVPPSLSSSHPPSYTILPHTTSVPLSASSTAPLQGQTLRSADAMPPVTPPVISNGQAGFVSDSTRAANVTALRNELSRALNCLKEAAAPPPTAAAAAARAGSQQIPSSVVSAVVAAAEAQQTALQELLEDRNLLLSRVEELDRVLSMLPMPGLAAQE